MSVNRAGNNLFIKPYEQYEVKSCAQNNVDNPLLSFQSKPDTFVKTTQNYQEDKIVDATSLRQDLEKTKEEQGFLGKLWDGFKNITGIGAGSSKAQQAIEDYENGLISKEEMEHAITGYQEGQKMVVDVVADMASGMASIVAFGAATAVLGPAGALLIAGATGTISKVGIKAGDALATGKEYTGKNLLYDTVTGGINGLLGPVTNGIGNTVTKTIATKFGISALKEGAEELAEQGIKQSFKQFAKSVVLNQSDDIIGGTLKQKTIAIGAGMAIDGALSGSADNMIRAGLNGENVLKAGAEGFVGGLIMAPIIGGGMKLAGKAGKALNNKILNKDMSQTLKSTVVKTEKVGHEELLENAIRYINDAGNIDSSLARDYIDAIHKAINEGKFDKLSPEKLKIAFELLNPDSVASKELRDLSESLYKKLINGNCVHTKNAADELARVLGFEGTFVKVEGKDLFVLKKDGTGTISARPKGTDSIFSKARNKVIELKEGFPVKIEELKPLIADAQGVRFVIGDSIKLQDADIIKILDADLADVDADSFIKYIRNIKKPNAKNIAKFEELEKLLYERINNLGADSFAESFAQAVKKGDIRITELHNYSSKDGIPYLNQRQIDTISEAYNEWYKARRQEALAKLGSYKLGTNEQGLECLIDENGNQFQKSLIIETLSNNRKAVKNNGYTATQFNLVSGDGDLVEFQYRGSQVDEMAEVEHIVYDCKKSKDTVAGEDYREIREIIGKIKNKKEIMEDYDRYFSDVYKAKRKQELGIEVKMPKIEDYLKDTNLTKNELEKISAEGIEELHKLIKTKKK